MEYTLTLPRRNVLLTGTLCAGVLFFMVNASSRTDWTVADADTLGVFQNSTDSDQDVPFLHTLGTPTFFTRLLILLVAVTGAHTLTIFAPLLGTPHAHTSIRAPPSLL